MAPPTRPKRGKTADNNSVGTPIRHTAGANGARTEHGALAHHKYGLMPLTGTEVESSDAGDQGYKDGHEATRGTANLAPRDTDKGDKTWQHTLPERSMQGLHNEGRIPPERLCMLNACGRQGGERGGVPST